MNQKYIKLVWRVVLFHCTSSWMYIHFENYFFPLPLFVPISSPQFGYFPRFSHPTPSLSLSPDILNPLPFNTPCYCHPFHPFSHYLLLPSSQSPYCQGCALRKTEGSPVLWTCGVQGSQHMICMQKLRFFSSPRASYTVGTTGHGCYQSTARPMLCYSQSFLPLSSLGAFHLSELTTRPFPL